MRPAEDRGLTDIVGGIYDASLDSSRWPEVVGNVVRFVGGQAGGLALRDSVSKNLNVFYDVGFDRDCIEVYLQTYSRFDPLATAPLMEAGQIANVPQLTSYEEYIAGRFYQEWARPHGWLDSANAILDKSGTGATFLRVVTSEDTGLVDDGMRRRLAAMVPHVRRATLIAKSIDLKHAEAASLAETLDGLDAGLILVDAAGRVVHANYAARDILAMDDFLRVQGGRLVARDGHVNQALRETFDGAGNGDAALGLKGIALPLIANDGDRYVAHVLPLSSGERSRAGTTYGAAAAVFVRKTALDTKSPVEIMGRAYKLTPTELRVLMAVIDVGGVPEVAETLGIADSTVKTHLKSLYQKTGATRHADLVKLAAGYSNPLAD